VCRSNFFSKKKGIAPIELNYEMMRH